MCTAIALGVAGVLLPAGVAAAAPAKTRVTISPEQTGFSGFVSSARESCANGRRVFVFRRVGRRVRLVTSDVAQPNGPNFMWAVQVPGRGRYFAAVRRTRLCAAARTRLASPQPAPVDGPPPGT